MIEEWRNVVGHSGYYVSNLGRVKSTKSGSARLRKLCVGSAGYLQLQLSHDGQKTTKYVHSLVFDAFHGTLDKEGYFNMVDHIDRNKFNNAASNLRRSNNTLNGLNSGKNITRTRGKYRVSVKCGGKSHYFGAYACQSEALEIAKRENDRIFAQVQAEFEQLEVARLLVLDIIRSLC